jgi:hypothetical protein
MMPALKTGGRMLRWGMLPIAAALVLALGSSPADADHKRHKNWNNGGGWGKHSQHWDNGWRRGKHSKHWDNGWGWGRYSGYWQPRHYYYPKPRYNYYYYAPPAYYYPPPAYYYPRPRYYQPHGSFSFGVTVPFD